MTWRAWTEKMAYNSREHEWVRDVPATGLQGVVVYHDDGTRTFYDGADWYWYYMGTWGFIASSNDWGTVQPRPTYVACVDCVKQGTAIAPEAFHRIQQRMRAATAP